MAAAKDPVFLYLKDVLGIKSWLSPLSQPDVDYSGSVLEFDGPLRPERQQKIWGLVFINLVAQPEDSYFQGPSRELFLKMKLAMKLSPDVQVLEVECSQDLYENNPQSFQNWILKNLKSQVYILFWNHHVSMVLDGDLWIQTWGPALMLKEDWLKKSAWSQLQIAMKKLSVSK